MKKSLRNRNSVLVVVLLIAVIALFVLKDKEADDSVMKTGVELKVVDKSIDETTMLTNESAVTLRSYILTVALDNDNTYDVECTSSAFDDIEIGEYYVFTVKADGQTIHKIYLE